MAKQQILKEQIEDSVIELDTATPSLTPIIGTTYKGTVPLTSLTLTNIPVSNIEIAIYFTTHATDAFTLTATDLVDKWYNVDVPTFDKNSEYVICIVNGNAVMAKIGE